jgi:hypothetical protein
MDGRDRGQSSVFHQQNPIRIPADKLVVVGDE